MTNLPCPTPPRRLLHVGCGPRRDASLPACFRAPHWQQVRLDIDPEVAPDIVASIADLSALEEASYDAIWSSHNLEHLDSFDVPRALAGFRRVLKPDGFALLTMPDLRAIALSIAANRLHEPLYHSAAGPISPLDMLFGHQASIAAGKVYMAHRTGFTATTLGQALVGAGFAEVRVHESRHWALWAAATMPHTDAAVFELLADVMQ